MRAGFLDPVLRLGTLAIVNGTSRSESLVGTSAADRISGLAGNDTLSGGAGNDTLDGGSGNDRLVGGANNDVYLVDSSADVVVETGSGVSEVDTVMASLSYVLGTNLERLTLTGTAAINGTGNSLANLLTGNAAANVLSSGAGNDTLNGGAGNDTLNGGVGNDAMSGGTGNDAYVVDSSFDTVSETSALASEIDRVSSSVAFTLGANIERLTLTGAAAINGVGNALNNVLVGNASGNILNGAAGSDTMTGGLENDTYVVDATGDVVIEASTLATEIDRVVSSIAYTLGANVERLTLSGSVAINGAGNGLANLLVGNAAANRLSGAAGADTLLGGLGNDTLDGGVGIDSMNGGNGNDWYYVDAVGDQVVEAGSSIAEIDAVVSTLQAYALPANVERLVLSGDAIYGNGNALDNRIDGNAGTDVLVGGAGDDTLYGNAGDDNLQGYGGDDVMVGGSGNDHYVVEDVGDVVIETSTIAGEVDEVTAVVSYTLGANVENLVLDSVVGVLHAGGNALANRITVNDAINTIDGAAGNDTLIGAARTDTLDGGEGNDSMAGGRADDLLYGGDGDDVLKGDDGADSLVGGAGSDDFVIGGPYDADVVADFVSGTDRILIDLATVGAIGNGDAVVDGAITQAGPGGWGAAHELVVFSTDLAALTAMNAATAAGDPASAVAAGSRALWVFDDGQQSGLYLFVSDGNAGVWEGELILLATLEGTPAGTVTADYFFAA